MPWNCEEKSIIDHQQELKGKKKKNFIIGKRVNIFPTCVDQTFSARSKDPDAMYLPSGLNDKECTASWCLERERTQEPRSSSHSLTVVSYEALKHIKTSWFNHSYMRSLLLQSQKVNNSLNKSLCTTVLHHKLSNHDWYSHDEKDSISRGDFFLIVRLL